MDGDLYVTKLPGTMLNKNILVRKDYKLPFNQSTLYNFVLITSMLSKFPAISWSPNAKKPRASARHLNYELLLCMSQNCRRRLRIDGKFVSTVSENEREHVMKLSFDDVQVIQQPYEEIKTFFHSVRAVRRKIIEPISEARRTL